MGSICGIGGGVIIKPVLDATGIIPVNTISFLSGCTVLSMSVISVTKNLRDSARPAFDKRIATMLAVGAVAGGLLGKSLYQRILSGLPDSQRVGAVQAGVLLAVTIGTLIYTIYKKNQHAACNRKCGLRDYRLHSRHDVGIFGNRRRTHQSGDTFYFFSMGTKQAAAYSLYIIMFSQTASLISSLVTRQVPEFTFLMIALMVICGVLGGLAGSRANKKIEERYVDRLFLGLMVVIILINIYNIIKYI